MSIADHWDGTEADCLVALHARRSAESIRAFAEQCADRPLVVVLTGTDLYRDIADDAAARHSLRVATRLVVLNERGPASLPVRLRAKTDIIVQSAPPLRRARKPASRIDVAVVGHLRAEKDPQLVWDLLAHLPAQARVHFLHMGAAYDAALGRRAAALARRDPRYRWLGDQPRSAARQLMRRAHVLLHPSRMEGGAQVVIEAVTAHTPVIASRIDGNTGLLGASYPGLFPVGDAAAAARLILRVAEDPEFLLRLERACTRRAPRFTPARESAAVLRLVTRLVHNRAQSPRRQKR